MLVLLAIAPPSQGSEPPTNPGRFKPFIIAKAGKPLVKVIAVNAPAAPKRFDFMSGQVAIPDDFDTMGQEEIEKLFYGDQ